MAVDSADNLVLVGYNTGDIEIDGSLLAGHGLDDAFVMKLRPDGSDLWSRLFGTGDYEDAQSVCIDDDDNLMFVDNAYGFPLDFGGGPIMTPSLYLAKLGP